MQVNKQENKSDAVLAELVKDAQKDDKIRLYRVLKIFARYEDKVIRLLDIGCNVGYIALLIQKACNAYDVYGIDNHEGRLSIAKERGIKTLQLNIDKEPYPFPDEYFDAIFAGEVIEHLDDPDHFFEETNRILRKRGLLVITTPNFASWYNRIALLLAFQPFMLDNSIRHADAGKMIKGGKWSLDYQGRHTKLYTRRALKELLELYGFSVMQNTGCPTPMEGRRLYILFNCIDWFMGFFGGSSGIIISCRKR
jgi:SAM-dependent methyltransferase